MIYRFELSHASNLDARMFIADIEDNVKEHLESPVFDPKNGDLARFSDGDHEYAAFLYYDGEWINIGSSSQFTENAWTYEMYAQRFASQYNFLDAYQKCDRAWWMLDACNFIIPKRVMVETLWKMTRQLLLSVRVDPFLYDCMTAIGHWLDEDRTYEQEKSMSETLFEFINDESTGRWLDVYILASKEIDVPYFERMQDIYVMEAVYFCFSSIDDSNSAAECVRRLSLAYRSLNSHDDFVENRLRELLPAHQIAEFIGNNK